MAHLCLAYLICTGFFWLAWYFQIRSPGTRTLLVSHERVQCTAPSGGDLTPSLGGRKFFFRGPRFLNDVIIGKKFPFSRQTIYEDLFLVIDQVFRIFPFFYQIFRIFTMLNIVYDPFLSRKTFFSTLFILSHASDNTTSQNIGGRMQGPSPTSNF